MSTAIAWRRVVKHYRRLRALDGLSLEVPAGSIFGLVGSNGAGKTTAFAIAAGLTRADEGTVDTFGGPFDPGRHAGRLTLLPQDSELPRDSRPREFLAFLGRLQGLSARAAASEADRLLELVHLTDRARVPARTLSHGMRKRVMIAQCFIGMPQIVLLDEPLSGLDPREVAHMREFLAAQRGRRTIVISSHNLHEIELLCDEVAFIERGRAVRSGSLASLTGALDSVHVHLGPGAEPPLAAVEAALPGAVVGWAPAERMLTIRYDPRRDRAELVHAVLLRTLLDAQVPILELSRGERLESVYLDAAGDPPRR
ncbi:MAG: ABC transporter ATP-binding protein [Kiritimatiellae bacterium]|nr:ABC transporter ATP-binding protein [Kiritimatiellia bacterium]